MSSQDMNSVIREIVDHRMDERTGQLIAASLINAGNAQRNAGFAILGPLSDKDLLTKPALLANNVSLLVVPFFRPTIQQMFRLLVTHVEGKRVFTAYLEDENNLTQSKFLNIEPEHYAELDRQLNAIGMSYEGSALVGLVIGNEAVEGYEYFTAAADEAAPAGEKVETNAAETVVESTPVADVAPANAG